MLVREEVTTARRLRRSMSPPEVMIWQRLRTRPSGKKFRRQHPIGPYVVDFYCAASKLVIEIDGGIHDDPEVAANDAYRAEELVRRGYGLFRLPASVVLKDPDEAAASIIAAADAPLHQPSAGPPPRAGEEKESTWTS